MSGRRHSVDFGSLLGPVPYPGGVGQIGADRSGQILGNVGALVGSVLLLVGPHVSVQVTTLAEPGEMLR